MFDMSSCSARLSRVLAIGTAACVLAACSGEIGSRGAAGSLGDPLVALGLRADPDRPYIEYGPRSPLVMPGQARPDLPLPQPSQTAQSEVWPDDPDERIRREQEAARVAAAQQGIADVEDAHRPMSRAELDEWGRRFGRGGAPRRSWGDGPAHVDHAAVVPPDELRAGRLDPDAPIAVPERRRLVEPPSQYRVPAPTAENAAEALPQEQPRRGWLRRTFGGG